MWPSCVQTANHMLVKFKNSEIQYLFWRLNLNAEALKFISWAIFCECFHFIVWSSSHIDATQIYRSKYTIIELVWNLIKIFSADTQLDPWHFDLPYIAVFVWIVCVSQCVMVCECFAVWGSRRMTLDLMMNWVIEFWIC